MSIRRLTLTIEANTAETFAKLCRESSIDLIIAMHSMNDTDINTERDDNSPGHNFTATSELIIKHNYVEGGAV